MAEKKKQTFAERIFRELSQNSVSLEEDSPRDAIQKWLSKPEQGYNAGLELFNKYSRNKGLLVQLMRKPQAELLLHELKKLFEQENELIPSKGIVAGLNTPVITPQLEEHAPPRLLIDKDGKIKYDDLPDELKKLYDLNSEEHKLMRGVHEKMKQAKSYKERAALREQLDDYDDAIAGRWGIIDNWAKTGNLPKPEIKTTISAGTLSAKELIRYRSGISRSLSNLEAGNVDEAKKPLIIENMKKAADALFADGQNFEDKTVERIRVFYPEFGVQD